MDNLTHSLIGAAIGRVATKKPDSTLFWTAVIASNMPDIDVALPAVDQVSSLLQHRGYTHSLLVLPITAGASALLGWLFTGRPKGKWLPLAVVSLVGVALHVGADFWNDYGVHPFFPFSSHWFYGDFIFIIEPLLWMTLATWLHFQARTRWGRALSGLLAVALLPIVWLSPFTGRAALWPVALFVSVFGIAAYAIQRRLRTQERKAVLATWALLLGILAVFKTVSLQAESRVRAEVQARKPSEKITDVILTPGPSNPLCWRVIPVSFEGQMYRARMGTLSLWPSLIDPSLCFSRANREVREGLSKVDLKDSEGFRWKAEFAGDWGELVELSLRDCRIERFIGWLRVPVWSEDGESVHLSDLRYSFGAGGFTDVDLTPDPEAKCPILKYPVWNPPALRHRF